MVVHCPKCSAEFSSKRDLERHLQRKTPCDVGKFKCQGCDQLFQTKKSLRVHINKQRCKGKNSTRIAQELAQENEELRNRVEQQEHLLHLTNSVTAAAASSSATITQNVQNITINIHNHPVCGLGQEKLTHFSQLPDSEMLKRINLTKGPAAMAAWCAMLRADENHPENHNALLLAADSKEMACCRDGKWTWDETNKTLLEISRSDMNRLYTHLGRYDQNEKVQTFRHEYLVHDLMTTANSDTLQLLKPVLDAVAQPIIALTNKFYAMPEEQNMTPKQLALQSTILQLKKQLEEQRSTFEDFEAKQMSTLLDLQRQLAVESGMS